MKKKKNENITASKKSTFDVSVLGAIPTFFAGLSSKFFGRFARPKPEPPVDSDTTHQKQNQKKFQEQTPVAFDEATPEQESPASGGYSFTDEYLADMDFKKTLTFEEEIRIVRDLCDAILDMELTPEVKDGYWSRILMVLNEWDKSKSDQQSEQILKNEKPTTSDSHEE